jgi:hypothetical protein
MADPVRSAVPSSAVLDYRNAARRLALGGGHAGAFFLGIALTTIGLGSSVAEARTTHHRSRHARAAMSCGGTERWDVKDGSDAGATDVHPVIVNGITIADLNQLSPQPLDADGRMQEEKVMYRLTGVLRLFKHDADGDYHVVIADDATTPYSVTRRKAGQTVHTPASGHSMVVEVPDPNCVAGAHREFGASHFLPQLQESRSDFEAATRNLPQNRDLGARNIPITVTGVLFFDFMHGQTGHGLPHPSQDSDTRDKVAELHPVLCNDVKHYREGRGKPAC